MKIFFRCIMFSLKAVTLFIFALSTGPIVQALASPEFRLRYAMFLWNQCDELDAECKAIDKELDKL